MKKSEAIEALIEVLQSGLDQMLRAARDAASYATDEESKAETKWDTQGLEASYLAAGQAAQADEVAQAIKALRQIDIKTKCKKVETGALVRCELGGESDWFLLSAAGGGTEAKVKRTDVTVITKESPLAQAMDTCAAGDEFTLPTGAAGKVMEVG